MIKVGVLPHQLIDCSWDEFMFDLNVLTGASEKAEHKRKIKEIIEKFRKKK